MSATALDSDQTLTVTGTIPTTGTSPYAWEWWISVNGGTYVVTTQCAVNSGTGASAGATVTCDIPGSTLADRVYVHLRAGGHGQCDGGRDPDVDGLPNGVGSVAADGTRSAVRERDGTRLQSDLDGDRDDPDDGNVALCMGVVGIGERWHVRRHDPVRGQQRHGSLGGRDGHLRPPW